ncbi:MAG: DUF1015 family protein [Spirochaetia bacterium]|jgi:uncharacterized protein (DUF1015 family)|nr:DUF1015 family protein [Spirochaetia bacterium]
MALVKAFKGIRPVKELAARVAELPYDVVDSAEARKIAEGNEYSFFHVTKAEIDLPPETDPYDSAVYAAGRDNLRNFIKKGILVQDSEPLLYLYTQIMNGRAQTGLAAVVSIDDYIASRVKKHELTREDKEKDRTTHLDVSGANTGPVFLIYREDGSKRSLFERGAALAPEYDFTAADGIRHIVRVIRDRELIGAFENSFRNDILYIADGHHRAASAVRVGTARREAHPDFTGDEEFNFFLAVIFPDNELAIMPYNRVVKDIHGRDEKSFMNLLRKTFDVKEEGPKVPSKKGNISMYLKGKWYTLAPLFRIDASDPIEGLDVKILQDNILQPVLGIDNPRIDNRIHFIGGIRGTDELEKLVDSGKYAVAFSMYPTSIDELMNAADADKIMPPKSTWFEPKLRDGLVIHSIE